MGEKLCKSNVVAQACNYFIRRLVKRIPTNANLFGSQIEVASQNKN